MSHEIENMFYLNSRKPWHGLGLGLEKDARISPEEALKASGADWDVRIEPLVRYDLIKGSINNNLDNINIENQNAIVRCDTNTTLGYAGKRYTIYNNKSMTEWFRPFIESGEAYFDTGGVLYNGQKTWFLCKINRDNSVIKTPNGIDEIEKYILLSNAFDGKTALRIGWVFSRIVCSNTLSLAINSKSSRLLRVIHSSRINQSMEIIRETMNVANQEFEATAKQYQLLANSKIVNQSDVKKYVKILLDVGNVEDKDISTRKKNIISEIIYLSKNGKGNTGETWYDAMNGVTEYLNYKYGRNQSSRLDSLWWGTNKTLSEKALSTALSMAG